MSSVPLQQHQLDRVRNVRLQNCVRILQIEKRIKENFEATNDFGI